MAAKKDNLPLSLRRDDDPTGTITYANEVIAIIAGVAANEVEGIAGMCTSGGITDVFGHNRNITKGVRVEIGSEEASVDLYVMVEYGTPIQTAALNVQENVRKAIETMTGLHVVRVDVHVQGVSFEKEKKEAQASLESVEMGRVTDGKEEPAEIRQENAKNRKKGKETPKADPETEPEEAPQTEPATDETAPAATATGAETPTDGSAIAPPEPDDSTGVGSEPETQA